MRPELLIGPPSYRPPVGRRPCTALLLPLLLLLLLLVLVLVLVLPLVLVLVLVLVPPHRTGASTSTSTWCSGRSDGVRRGRSSSCRTVKTVTTPRAARPCLPAAENTSWYECA